MEQLQKGAKIWQSGAVISVKDKIDRRGRPFTGVTFKAMDGYLYWFRLESHHGDRPAVNHPLEAVGYVTGQTGDLELRFLEDVKVINCQDSVEDRRAAADDWFDQNDEVRNYNDTIRAEQRADGQVVVEGELPLGTYTVQFEDGEYRTIRIKPPIKNSWNPDLEGWQFIGFLCGPENDTAYKNFAYRKADESAVRLKNGFGDDSALVTCLRALLTGNPESRREMGVRWAKQSGNCYICGRTLTTPESIEAGIGPVCINK